MLFWQWLRWILGCRMTQFASTIITDTIQSGLPSDWTQVSGTFTAQIVADMTSGYSNRILNTSSVSASGDVTWNPPGSQTDQEALMLVQFSGTLGFPGTLTTVCVRHQGVALQFYTIGFILASSSGGTSWQFGGGIGSPVSFTWSANAWYWVRLNVTGTTLSGKVWSPAVPEPKDFQSTATDNTWASGKIGTRLTSNLINIAVLSSASGTDTAPTPLSLSQFVFTP